MPRAWMQVPLLLMIVVGSSSQLVSVFACDGDASMSSFWPWCDCKFLTSFLCADLHNAVPNSVWELDPQAHCDKFNTALDANITKLLPGNNSLDQGSSIAREGFATKAGVEVFCLIGPASVGREGPGRLLLHLFIFRSLDVKLVWY